MCYGRFLSKRKSIYQILSKKLNLCRILMIFVENFLNYLI